mgnify:CR=1 FL=1
MTNRERNWTYSYSGSDCDAYAFFPGSEELRAYMDNIRPNEDAGANSIGNQLEEGSLSALSVQSIASASQAGSNGNTVLPNLNANSTANREAQVSRNFFTPVKLSSMATISVSIHEAKSPVRRLGERGVNGYTRGIRTIAGTIVFLVIEDHPLRALAVKDPANLYSDLIGWSRDTTTKGVGSAESMNKDISFDNKISTLISPLNIMLRYQTEVAIYKDEITGGVPGASMIIEGVEFVNEGIVTSVNDMVTEVVCQFVAQDIRPFTSTDAFTTEDIIVEYAKINANKKYHETYYRELINNQRAKTSNVRTFGTTTIIDED